MIGSLQVLFVGTPETHWHMRNSLLAWQPGSKPLMTSGVIELSDLLLSERVCVAVLHDTLSEIELKSCAAYIRHHWSCACILLIHERADMLDDPMYDERIQPNPSPTTLCAAIERLALYAQERTEPRKNTKLHDRRPPAFTTEVRMYQHFCLPMKTRT